MAVLSNVGYPGLWTLSVNNQDPDIGINKPWMSTLYFPQQVYYPGSYKQKIDKLKQDLISKSSDTNQIAKSSDTNQTVTKSSGTNQILASGVGIGTDYLSNLASDKLFGDSENNRNFAADY